MRYDIIYIGGGLNQWVYTKSQDKVYEVLDDGTIFTHIANISAGVVDDIEIFESKSVPGKIPDISNRLNDLPDGVAKVDIEKSGRKLFLSESDAKVESKVIKTINKGKLSKKVLAGKEADSAAKETEQKLEEVKAKADAAKDNVKVAKTKAAASVASSEAEASMLPMKVTAGAVSLAVGFLAYNTAVAKTAAAPQTEAPDAVSIAVSSSILNILVPNQVPNINVVDNIVIETKNPSNPTFIIC